MTKNVKYNNSPYSTRDGFGEGLAEAGKLNNDIVVLTADLTDSTRSTEFEKLFPERFVEVGVAEQNMAGIAAGLALSGKIPFINSYAVFSPGRNWDQIRVSICLTNANVKIAGFHAGLSAGPDGATHQALEDIAMLRVLPNMIVLSPCDYFEAKRVAMAAANHKGPVYIRLFKEPALPITKENDPFEIGKAYVLHEGKDVTVISAGPILSEVLAAQKELKSENSVSCEVINCVTIKPLDEETILKSVKKTQKVVVVEEHQIAGGLGSAICELLSQKMPVKVKLMGMHDSFGESGKYSELLQKYGLDKKSIKNSIMEAASFRMK